MLIFDKVKKFLEVPVVTVIYWYRGILFLAINYFRNFWYVVYGFVRRGKKEEKFEDTKEVLLVGFTLFNLKFSVQCFVEQCLSFSPFSFGQCIVCPSIDGFRLPLWYLQTFLLFSPFWQNHKQHIKSF
jgi:hypothetical protein